MSFLVDTNVVSELRKGGRANPNVRQWYGSLADEDVFLSVLTVGELRRGVELIRRRDTRSVESLDAWLAQIVTGHAERLLPVDDNVAEMWGRLSVPDRVPVIDGLLSATAMVHGLTLATRNVKDIERTGVSFVNPFA